MRSHKYKHTQDIKIQFGKGSRSKVNVHPYHDLHHQSSKNSTTINQADHAICNVDVFFFLVRFGNHCAKPPPGCIFANSPARQLCKGRRHSGQHNASHPVAPALFRPPRACGRPNSSDILVLSRLSENRSNNLTTVCILKVRSSKMPELKFIKLHHCFIIGLISSVAVLGGCLEPYAYSSPPRATNFITISSPLRATFDAKC